MTRWVSRWLPLPILAVGAFAAWGLAQGRPAPDAPAPELSRPPTDVIAVAPRRHRTVVRAHGTVAPRTEIELVVETSGRVARVSERLATGAFFEEGDLLVELDPTDAALALERAEALVLRSESEERIAGARLARQRSLARSDVSSSAQLEEAQHALAVARAALRDARAARDQARRTLERTSVRAPFAGRVRARHVGVGQFVARGAPLARVYAVDYAEVRLPISAAELAFLELPAASGEGAGARVVLRAAFAGRQREWPARLVRAEGAIDDRTRMLHVVARVEDPYARAPGAPHTELPVGLFVEAEIEGRAFDDVYLLPREALHGPAQVWVVDAEGRTRRRPVEVLRRGREQVIVRAGLEPGERVCAAAAGNAEGAAVQPRLVDPVPVRSAP